MLDALRRRLAPIPLAFTVASLPLRFLALRGQSRIELEAEVLVLRHQLEVLRRQVPRPSYEERDRAVLAALSRLVPRQRWSRAFLVTPPTLLRWHRRFVNGLIYRSERRPGRPPTEAHLETLVCRLADENPSWGYRRIHGELAGLGYSTVGATTAWDILKRNGISPAPRNRESTWAEFLRTQAAGIVACDFFTVPTITLHHLHVLVFIHHVTREILHIAVTHNPTARFTTNAAKGLLMRLDDMGATIKFVIRDRGGQYAPDLFDHVFTTSDVRVISTPLRSPRANAICERVIGTLRRECTDHFLILGPTHLHRILREYIEHYNQHRISLGVENLSRAVARRRLGALAATHLQGCRARRTSVCALQKHLFSVTGLRARASHHTCCTRRRALTSRHPAPLPDSVP